VKAVVVVPPPLSSVSTLYSSVPPPLATVVTEAGIFITDGSPTLISLSSTNITFPGPITSIATDLLGNIYVTTSSAVYQNGSNGIVNMNITGLNNITALAVNSNMFYMVNGDSQIYSAFNSSVATSIAGSVAGFADGPGSSAQFYNPEGIVLDPTSTNLFVSDTNNSLIRSVSTSPPYTVTTLAGNSTVFINPTPTDSVGNKDGNGTGSETLLFCPKGITVSPPGVLYIADTNNNNIRSLVNGNLLTVAGKPGVDPIYDISPPGYVDGVAGNALFTAPQSIFCYNSLLYVTEPSNGTVRVVKLV
jgi:sugar lactone lactonase YvrE